MENSTTKISLRSWKHYKTTVRTQFKKKCPQLFNINYFFREIPSSSADRLILKIGTDACKGTDTEVNYLEHVQAVITANSSRRGDLEMFLTSPMGTSSMILSKRNNDDDHRDGFTKWPFMTTHTWGEYPQGTWILEVCVINCFFILPIII